LKDWIVRRRGNGFKRYREEKGTPDGFFTVLDTSKFFISTTVMAAFQPPSQIGDRN
jgi:hypothetical protein